MEKRNFKNLLVNLLICFFVSQLFFASPAQAQGTGKIAGVVRDVETGDPLPGANVQISKTLLGASTEVNGRFLIRQVPPGLHVVRVSFIGYRSEQLRIRVQRDSTSQIQVALRPSAIAFEQVIVTGSRQQEDLRSAANSVSVIAPLEIRRRNRFRIDESLQTIAGVTLVGENVNVRGGSGYALLGLGASRVLMLIDDVPVLTSDLGRANWDILPVTEVERVEVLKGAASVLYGSGGISGVVNILTRRPTSTPSFSFRQSAGIYDDPSVSEWHWTQRSLYYYRTDVSFSTTFRRLGLRLAVSRHESTGDRENGDFRRWYFTGKAVHNFPDNSVLTLFATYSRDARGFFFKLQDLNSPLKSDTHDRINVDGTAASLVYNKLFSPKLSSKVRLSYNAQLIGLPFEISKDFKPALGFSGEVQTNWLPHPDHSLLFGVDYKRDEVEAKYYGTHQGNAVSPYFQDIWKISHIWQIHAGLRYDTYILVGDSAETQLSPKIGASYNFLPGSILHFSIGRGFRAPSIAERFTTFRSKSGFELLSNPYLQPERSTLIDVGVRQSINESFSAEVTAFWNQYNDLIELDQKKAPELRFLNYARTRMRGIETELKGRWWANRLGLQASMSWMEAQSLSDDIQSGLKKNQMLPYRPRFTAFVSPSLSLGPATLEADYRYVSRYEKTLSFPQEVPQKVWDLRLLYRWRQLTMQLGVKNAINYNYAPVERILGEIRNFSFSIYGDF
ncbi:MAG: TonB-dependent receptor [candidate division KSB1 bacterium]|nr:TonB-dependent receptor [candidate division KSB1 bacterium]MDZ7305084.1 TonB-dependent receptor [candidate division KSB1 bacterium]MDZ7313401.1 TonB-dependent receptor [candidate division KSB1 bacterium]